MTANQAVSIRKHLIQSLNESGFGEIVLEVNTRLEEDIIDDSFHMDPITHLLFFLRESINALKNISNDNYETIINRLNQYVITDNNPIKAITVELVSQGEPKYYDLKGLPSYKKIINVFEEIYDEIQTKN
jgi:hypothetical protein